MLQEDLNLRVEHVCLPYHLGEEKRRDRDRNRQRERQGLDRDRDRDRRRELTGGLLYSRKT